MRLDTYLPCKQSEAFLVEAMPDGLNKGDAHSATQRKPSPTFRFYTRDALLVDSGLMNPVQISVGVNNNLSAP